MSKFVMEEVKDHDKVCRKNEVQFDQLGWDEETQRFDKTKYVCGCCEKVCQQSLQRSFASLRCCWLNLSCLSS